MKAQVMIVDDDASIAMCVDKVLTAAGYPVLKTPTGTACLEILRAGFRGLVLMDIMMPKMDGWATLRAAVQEGVHAGNLICMLTAIEDPGGAGGGVTGVCISLPAQTFRKRGVAGHGSGSLRVSERRRVNTGYGA